MLDAALAYARCGFPVFPVTVKKKVPIPKRDPDPTGKLKDGIPGTGGHYKATTDPIVIHDWWDEHPKALIGLPMGAVSGVWALDVDTAEDHTEGVTGWDELTKQHESIVTREHRSATGGPHLIFRWHPEQPIRCSAGSLPSGIQVRGEGGYIVVPPSRRKGRSYTVYNDIDPTDAPQWLLDKILQGRTASEASYSGAEQSPAEYEEIADAMRFVPNLKCDWVYWTEWGLAIYAATAGKGFAIFDEWSAKSEDYDANETRKRWKEITGSPPSRTGAGKIFKAARANGWVPKPRTIEPTYAAPSYTDIKAARRELRRLFREFLRQVTEGFPPDPSCWSYIAQGLEIPPAVWGVCVDTGVGKTMFIIAEIARWLRNGGTGPIVYCVPTHRLSPKIAEQFAELGVNASLFRGRTQPDPEDPKPDDEKKQKMCLNMGAVKLAMLLRADINDTCCKQGSRECRFFNRCGYWRQVPDEMPDVWIVAHDMLFHYQKVFGDPVAVIIDEGMWQKGLQGLSGDEDEVVISLASIYNENTATELENGDLAFYREELVDMLARQSNNGPLKRPTDGWVSAAAALRLEWQHYDRLFKEIKLYPGMSEIEVSESVSLEDLIDAIQHTRHMITIWGEVNDFMYAHNITVSGRLELKQRNGLRSLQWRGLREINRKFQVPTLLLDATLPDVSILKMYHPRAKVVADIKVSMPPHVHIQQIVDAPTSSNKLKNEGHLQELRRYILGCWIENDHPATLVITQMQAAEWLIQSVLPEGIKVEHYNAIAGLDEYKNVGLLILAGRTQPGPQAIEATTGALTGRKPVPAPTNMLGFQWHERVKRGIRLTGGSDGREVKGDQHPDPVAEMVRWLICEGEEIQALGRARAVNREADKPLIVKLLFDTCLPISVNEVVTWIKPSLLIETAITGVVLKSPVDLIRLWPKIWPNKSAADRTLVAGVPQLPSFVLVRYQLVGAKMKPREGYFDHNLIPDPQAWLAERLGPLVPL